jgi:hypothetical protein
MPESPRLPQPLHLVVATPCFGGTVNVHYTRSLLDLQATFARRKLDVSFQFIGGDALVTRARNVMVQQFLAQENATHLLFIDADIGFSPDQVLSLLTADKDVCGAIYPLKRVDWDRVGAHARAGVADFRASALNYVVDLLDREQNPTLTDFIRVRSIGTGFMLIRRSVFERMAAHYPDLAYGALHVGSNADIARARAHAFFDCVIDRETGAYLSEDYTFCKRWTDMGGEIWADTRSRLTHVGPYAFQGDLRAALDLVYGAAQATVDTGNT